MYVGVGIFLLVVGAVLAFATTLGIHGVDLTLVGWILMAGGLLAIVLSLLLSHRRGVSSRQVTHVDPATGTRVRDTHIE
jgi:hypothetical protein